MPYCPECGEEVDEDWVHCSGCGEKLPDISSGGQERSQEETEPTVQKNNMEGVLFTTSQLRLGASLGFVVIVISTLLPWFSAEILASSVQRTGLQTPDGKLLLGTAAVGLVIVGVNWGRIGRVTGLMVGLGSTLLSGLYIANPLFGARAELSQQYTAQEIEAAASVVQPDIGLYLTVIGGTIAMVAGGAASLRSDWKTEHPSSSDTPKKESGEALAPPSYHTRPPEEQALLEDIEKALESESVLTDSEIKHRFYNDHPLEQSDRQTWWADVQVLLQNVDEIEQLDSTGRRWGLADK